MCAAERFERTHSLPLSRSDPPPQQQQLLHEEGSGGGLRRRLSSLSLKIHPISSHPAASWAFQRSKSLSSIREHAGSSLRKWWDWGWSWVIAKKRTSARDLEMDDDQATSTTTLLASGSQQPPQSQRASWRHVYYKVRSEIKRLTGSNRVGLPQTCRYNSFDYSKNFDDGEIR